LAAHHDPESVEIAEHVFLSAYGAADAEAATHFLRFKEFLSAIDRSGSHTTASHGLFFTWPTFFERFKNAADRDHSFPLLDYSNEAVESRLRLAEIAPYLSRSLIASAVDHSAEAVWRLLRELSTPPPQDDAVHIFLNFRDKDMFLLSQPLFTMGDLVTLNSEAVHV
jgi:hypothetical protein